MKDNKDTIQLPGHSERGSGDGLDVVLVVVMGTGVGGRGLGFIVVETIDLLLSQQMLPLSQDVCEIKMEGRLQNAAIILRKQTPGHRGAVSVIG